MPVKGSRGSARHSSGPRHHKHKHTKKYLQPYWPYIPLVIVVIVGLFFGSFRPQAGGGFSSVLAYATNTSASGLLQATNSQRVSNGQAGLGLNILLNSAAQAKANDMVARNYWSHTTPDGQQPWVFIQNAGYSYSKAGENLAYGFATSDDTVTGWMNSAPHRANILDAGFTEVGFGIANSPNFVGIGQTTVVVAMYAKPQVLGASAQASAAPATPPPTTAQATTPAAAPAPASTAESTAPAAETAAPAAKDEPEPVTSAAPTVNEPASLAITRGQTIASGRTPWIVSLIGLLSSLAILALLLKHSLQVKSILRQGERFVLKHPVFDTVMVSVIMLAYVFSTTSGVIR